jgi:chorismate mutase/prephenate dehydratase
MKLSELRRKIDAIDDKIVELLNERMVYAKEIGKLKRREGKAVFRPDRENKILKRLTEKSDLFPKPALLSVYRHIFSASLKAEAPLTIAYLGPAATFTHQAAEQRFGSQSNLVPVKDIPDVFLEVEKGKADYGVVPIENSSEGIVSHTLDMFIDSNLKIADEIFLEISHSLLSKEPSLSDIKKVYSHPQSFAQCRNWLTENLPMAELIETSSTASATQRAQREKGSAAIASNWAAGFYGIPVLEERIEDLSENTTRFLVIGKEFSAPTGSDKTSILFSVKDRVGALYDMLKPFAEHKINLTKIESRPSRNIPWEYIFFLDFVGHIQDERVKSALSELENLCVHLKILGSYPKGDG